jgi:hypothetical protein
MHRGYRYLVSFFLTAALTAPVAMMASTSPQDDRRQEERQRENNRRYYDRTHKDYHRWDDNEGRAYQRYQSERHERRDFDRLNRRRQSDYWNWRHEHPDNR